jgi:very-short-patch-repair endonuclease
MANEIARRLRKAMTPQEVKLWVHLHTWRKRGYHFRRQSPQGDAIVDFVCLQHRLVVEVDGGQHGWDANIRRDRARDEQLSLQGFRILRFWNSDVDRNLDGVLLQIDAALRTAPPPVRPSAGHPPPSGEG